MSLIKEVARVDELDYKGILRKQNSVTRLFPQFYDRVKQVGRSGGVTLQKQEGDKWLFTVASATKSGKEYDNYIRWVDLENQIRVQMADSSLWKSDQSGVDVKKLASVILYQTDVELFCSCPAFLYFGPAYILTTRKAKYTKPENRPPEVRNPREYGAVCKHLQLVLDVLPFYLNTMVKYLNTAHAKLIASIEKQYKKVRQ